jgi:hypothetical protein
MTKLNCWEFMKCGRELGGNKAFELGVCPATTDVRFDGANWGINAGRACWVIPGTMCHEQIQGDFSDKSSICAQCVFYHVVKKEGDEQFIPTVVLLHRLEINV